MPRTAGLRGALPPHPERPFRPLRAYLTAELPSPPGPFGYGEDLSFPMALNDVYGDCTVAGVVHAAQIQADVVGAPYVYPGDAAVQEAYFALTGGKDSGLVLSAVVGAWTKGVLGSKLVGAATIDIRDEKLMAQALYNFGCLYVGVALPYSAETQFNDGIPWQLGGPPNMAGGHCVVLNGCSTVKVHNAAGTVRTVGDFNLVTWGAETAATDGWWRYYGSEAWVLIPEVYVRAGHDALRSIDLVQMRADLRALSAA